MPARTGQIRFAGDAPFLMLWVLWLLWRGRKRAGQGNRDVFVMTTLLPLVRSVLQTKARRRLHQRRAVQFLLAVSGFLRKSLESLRPCERGKRAMECAVVVLGKHLFRSGLVGRPRPAKDACVLNFRFSQFTRVIATIGLGIQCVGHKTFM